MKILFLDKSSIAAAESTIIASFDSLPPLARIGCVRGDTFEEDIDSLRADTLIDSLVTAVIYRRGLSKSRILSAASMAALTFLLTAASSRRSRSRSSDCLDLVELRTDHLK